MANPKTLDDELCYVISKIDRELGELQGLDFPIPQSSQICEPAVSGFYDQLSWTRGRQDDADIQAQAEFER